MLAKNVDDFWGQLDQRVGKGGRLAAFLGPLDVGAQGAATGRDDASGTEQGHNADCDSRPNLQRADQNHSPNYLTMTKAGTLALPGESNQPVRLSN